eukprot:TRINITY_DN7982_c0_g1_i1.p1 TRINITY_DN7982_c0_g1~~TRINITY_DN7982_c0_g1_i1.p1  ORF type:complete len:636 (+),score=215.12 TRINITY_DN7982_c0_g1_i1:113-2020(+)
MLSPPRKFSSKGEELYVRGLEKLKEKEKKHEDREKEVEQEELESLKKTPRILKSAQNGRNGVTFAEYTRLWEIRRQEKLEEERRKQKEIEEEEVVEAPKSFVSSRSAEILKKSGRRKGVISDWEEHVMRRQELRTRGEASPIRSPKLRTHVPSDIITTDTLMSSTEMSEPSSVNACHRLYEMALERQEKLERNEVERSLGKQTTFPDGTSPTKKNPSSPASIKLRCEILHSQADIIRRKKEAEQERLMMEKCPFKPHVSEKSKRLVESRPRKPLYVPPSHPPTQRPASAITGDAKKLRSPKRLSPEMSGFLQRSQERQRASEERMAALRHQREVEELHGCTFTPSLDPKSVVIAERAHAKLFLGGGGLRDMDERRFEHFDAGDYTHSHLHFHQQQHPVDRVDRALRFDDDASQASTMVSSLDHVGGPDMYQHAVARRMQREDELQQRRRKSTDAAEREATFSPNLSRSARSHRLSSSGREELEEDMDSVGMPRSPEDPMDSVREDLTEIEGFLQRHGLMDSPSRRMMRRRQMEKEKEEFDSQGFPAPIINDVDRGAIVEKNTDADSDIDASEGLGVSDDIETKQDSMNPEEDEIDVPKTEVDAREKQFRTLEEIEANVAQIFDEYTKLEKDVSQG